MSVDESLMMWKGCMPWKVYIPSKCARFGTKSLELCETKLVTYGILLFILGRTPFCMSP
jgi:hypothetical protein